MSVIERLNKKDWSPVSGQVDKESLNDMLHVPKKKTLFCFHKWVYWAFGNAPKLHRVCKNAIKSNKTHKQFLILKVGGLKNEKFKYMYI